MIISSNYIATLDECIDSNRKLAAMNIASVDEELSQSGKFIANIKDPAYVSLGSLAIIKMNKPLQFTETVRPICISEDFNIKSDKLVHVNWGKENEQRVKVTTLKQYYLKKTGKTFAEQLKYFTIKYTPSITFQISPIFGLVLESKKTWFEEDLLLWKKWTTSGA